MVEPSSAEEAREYAERQLQQQILLKEAAAREAERRLDRRTSNDGDEGEDGEDRGKLRNRLKAAVRRTNIVRHGFDLSG